MSLADTSSTFWQSCSHVLRQHFYNFLMRWTVLKVSKLDLRFTSEAIFQTCGYLNNFFLAWNDWQVETRSCTLRRRYQEVLRIGACLKCNCLPSLGIFAPPLVSAIYLQMKCQMAWISFANLKSFKIPIRILFFSTEWANGHFLTNSSCSGTKLKYFPVGEISSSFCIIIVISWYLLTTPRMSNLVINTTRWF